MGRAISFGELEPRPTYGSHYFLNQLPVCAGVLGLPEDVVVLTQTDNVPRISKGRGVGAGDEVFGLEGGVAGRVCFKVCSNHTPAIALNDNLPQ